MDNYVKKLFEQGWSKYRIAKEMDVSWNTVQFWFKEVFKPSPNNQKKLEALYGKGEL